MRISRYGVLSAQLDGVGVAVDGHFVLRAALVVADLERACGGDYAARLWQSSSHKTAFTRMKTPISIIVTNKTIIDMLCFYMLCYDMIRYAMIR